MDNNNHFKHIVAIALAEDIGQGDVTSAATIAEAATATMCITARQSLVVCGLAVLDEVFEQLTQHSSFRRKPESSLGCSDNNKLDSGFRRNDKIQIAHKVKEGQIFSAGTVLAKLKGNARTLLTGERVALNIMQRLSGVATLTKQYVDAVTGTKAIILDTRKTMPGMRQLDKYAVTVGGGQNHRMRLDDMVLIKDNHIAVCGGIKAAVQKARAYTTLPIEVECDTLGQLTEAIEAMPDRIMLDNMSVDMLKKAVTLAGGKVKLEASGGVNLDTVQAIASSGVDYISVGALTHSALAVDIAADIVVEE